MSLPPQTHKYWAWMDPGAFALLGSVSFFGGVTRLTMSLTVIMVEITNDIHQLLLIMITIMVAKWTGDMLSGRRVFIRDTSRSDHPQTQTSISLTFP